MTQAAEYRLSGYISVSPKRNGVLYPIYRHGSVNWPFVQETDSAGCITSFIPFYDSDKFEFVTSVSDVAVAIGDASRFGFFDGGGCLVEIDAETFGSEVRVGNFVLENANVSRLTQLGLARLARLPSQQIVEHLCSYLEERQIGQHAVRRAQRAEYRAQLRINDWWDKISSSEFGDLRAAKELRESTIDELFEWLFSHEVDDEWKNVFLILSKRVMFDERFVILFENFIAQKNNLTEFNKLDKLITARMLEHFNFGDQDFNDLADLLYDELVSGDIFYLVGSASNQTIMDFIYRISEKASDGKSAGGDLLNIIDSIIDYVAGELSHPKIFNDLIEFLLKSDELLLEYPENSVFREMTRLDRLLVEFEFNGRFQLNLSSKNRAILLEIIEDE